MQPPRRRLLPKQHQLKKFTCLSLKKRLIVLPSLEMSR
jgi:hypothetical protein